MFTTQLSNSAIGFQRLNEHFRNNSAILMNIEILDLFWLLHKLVKNWIVCFGITGCSQDSNDKILW